MVGSIIALSADSAHSFSKPLQPEFRLVAGHGVAGDAHAGETVQHLSRIRRDPAAPNLRQIHLIHAELFDYLAAKGFTIRSGDIGENVTTLGIDLLGLSRGTRLRLGSEAVIEVTGLRNPCVQLDRFTPGLMNAVLGRAANGTVIRKSGIMAVVITGGTVSVGEEISLAFVPRAHVALEPV